MKIEFFFEKNAAELGTAVYIVQTDVNGARQIAKPAVLEFAPHDRSQYTTPTFYFEDPRAGEFFQALVDGLARAGYRYESSDVGELKATKTHLEDMRKLTFDLIGKV